MKKIICLLMGLLCCTQTTVAQSLKREKKNELKVALLSLASGTSKLTYQRLVRDHQCIELTAGIIGWGFDKLKNSEPKGTAWRAAYKFMFNNRHPDYSPMYGFYIKPELCYSSYQYNRLNERLKVDRVATMGVIGYDWVIDWFVFDIYGGAGFAMGDSNKSNYHHGFIGLNDHTPFAFTAGFRVGCAF